MKYWNDKDIISNASFRTPAFVYDENKILLKINSLNEMSSRRLYLLLFAIKSFSTIDLLKFLVPYVDGFSASSLFEARLARDVLGPKKHIHLTSPILKTDEMNFIGLMCNYISFNSLNQWEVHYKHLGENINCGLRINPQLSFVNDDRYNPSRKYSKLGVPLNILKEIYENGSNPLQNIKGLHFHTNCESTDFESLFKTIMHIDAHLPKLMGQMEWINLGGGYLLEEGQRFDMFVEAVNFLKNKYNIDVFYEPGKAIVGDAGYIVSSVVDIFKSDGRKIAILDTSVNHMPEVFEYQYKPDIMQESVDGKYIYTLAGCTCLSGDLFGDYRFDEPLEIGSRIVFEDMGAYTLVKANMFNGVNLPTIYALTTEGKLELKKQFGYEDFKSRCGA
jgi:carboxynorspermidine decarboxylase